MARPNTHHDRATLSSGHGNNEYIFFKTFCIRFGIMSFHCKLGTFEKRWQMKVIGFVQLFSDRFHHAVSSSNNLSGGKPQLWSFFPILPTSADGAVLGSERATVRWGLAAIIGRLRFLQRLGIDCLFCDSRAILKKGQLALFQVSGWQRPQPNLPLRPPRRRKNRRSSEKAKP